jgi:flagellar capping protein FliD
MATSSSTSAISLSMPSGLDDTSIINQLVSLEQARVTKVQNEKVKDQYQIDAYSKIRGYLEDIKSKATTLGDKSSFDLFTSNSTNSDAVTISGGTGSVDGQYDVAVSQIAGSEKMISASGVITDQKATLASQGIHIGDISIAGTTISIKDTDTIQDLRAKINSATDLSGKKLGVTASVIKTGENDYRLVLVSKDTGAKGVAYQDVNGGKTLQDLGIVIDDAGNKGNIQQQLQSNDVIGTDDAWNAIAAGTAIHFEGTDHNGQQVSYTFVKNAGTTSADFLKRINTAFNNTVAASFDANGYLVITDATTGLSQLNLTHLTIGATDKAVGIAQSGENGAGVLSVGRDAYFNIEGMAMQSSTNSVTGFVPGSTFTLKKATGGDPVTVSLTRDLSSIEQKISDLLTSYNSLSAYGKQATQLADPNNSNTQDGDLAGDMTVASIVDSVRATFSQSYDKLGGTFSSLAQIGIKSDSKTGDLSLDKEKFEKAWNSDDEGVQNLFVTVGVSDNPNVSMGLNSKNTKPGRYDLEEADPYHVRLRLQGTADWYLSNFRVGDVVNFSDGPVAGLSLSVPQGSITGTSTFTLSKGLSTLLGETIMNLEDSQTGPLALRQNSLQQSMKDADQRISDLQDRVDSYRDRLTKQFSAMESAISNIKAESARISGTFGSSS